MRNASLGNGGETAALCANYQYQPWRAPALHCGLMPTNLITVDLAASAAMNRANSAGEVGGTASEQTLTEVSRARATRSKAPQLIALTPQVPSQKPMRC
jgi:hypothetical protein